MNTESCACPNKQAYPEISRRFSGCGYINIDPSVVKTWVRLVRSKFDPVTVALEDIRIDIVRKGSNVPIAAYRAFSRDLDNKVSFYWDDLFLAAPVGYYVGDVYVYDRYCFSLEFRIRGCELEAVDCDNEYEGICGVNTVLGAAATPCSNNGLELDIKEQ